MTSLPCYGLTIGDPTGIGPEITRKTLEILAQSRPPYRLRIYGDLTTLQQDAGFWNPLQSLDWLEWAPIPKTQNKLSGQVAYEAIEQAISDIATGQMQGLATGPISKEALWRAGLSWPGHTEILEMLANRWWPQTTDQSAYQAEMAFLFGRFRLLLLTRHVPLAQVSEALDPAAIERALTTLVNFLQTQEAIARPRIAIMGVNPHAGEIGGSEERDILMPVLARLRQLSNAEWIGPVAADGLFRGFDANNPPYDAYVATYHDQGLIPMKLVGGWSTVNVTLGLPFVRTSVSHGTAPDIVGRGIASPDSLLAALDCLHRLVTKPSC